MACFLVPKIKQPPILFVIFITQESRGLACLR